MARKPDREPGFGTPCVAAPSSGRPVKPEAPRPVGIECLTCGCRMLDTVETRPAYGGRIMRRKACRNCGRILTVYETPVEAPPEDPHRPWWKQRRSHE